MACSAGRAFVLSLLDRRQTQARGLSFHSMRWCGMTVSLDGLLREPAEVACTCDFLCTDCSFTLSPEKKNEVSTPHGAFSGMNGRFSVGPGVPPWSFFSCPLCLLLVKNR